MKIYGKTLREIFADMSLSEKIIVIAGSAFLIFTAAHIPLTLLTAALRDSDPPAPLLLGGMKGYTGFADPSIAVAKDGEKAIMALTVMRRAGTGEDLARTEVRLMTSQTPACKRWMPALGGFQSRDEEVVGPDGATPVKKGIWRAETPTIIFDAGDPGREWKLFAYRYFWAGDVPLARLYSMIIYATADKNGKKWSQEEWIFSASANAPPAPYANLVGTRLNDLDPSLADVYFYARPSAVMAGNDILMSLSAFVRGRDTPDRIILIKSSDHGRSWQYLGTPLRADDAAKVGAYTSLGGGSLMIHEGALYLAAVFGDEKAAGMGTFVISFTDAITAQVARNAAGAPVVTRHIPRLSEAPTPTGGGFATYAEECDIGVVTSEFSGLKQDYSLFKSMMRPVED